MQLAVIINANVNQIFRADTLKINPKSLKIMLFCIAALST